MQSARRPWCAIYRAAGIGDLLIASSPVAQLAKTFNVEVMCDKSYGELWEHNPHVAKITEFPNGTLPTDLMEWIKWFRTQSKAYNAFYNLSQTCEVSLALANGQVAFDWPASARRKLCDRNYLEMVHDVCEVPYDFDPGPRFYASDEEKADAIRVKGTVGERVIGIPVSGSRIDKVWPWLPMLAAKIISQLKLPVILFGAPNGRDVEIANRAHEIVAKLNGSDKDLHCCISKDTKEQTVTWSMRRNMAQLQTCDLVIAPDTGLAWSVAMEPMPKIVIVSHASPRNITDHWIATTTLHADAKRVPCWPCHRLHESPETCVKAEKVDAAACMDDVHDEVVLEHIRKLLAPARNQVGPHATDNGGPKVTVADGVAFASPAVSYDAPDGYVGLRRVDAAAN